MDHDQALAILGLKPGASQAQIRQAYMELAQIFHPDKHQGQSKGVQERANKKFQDLQVAYAELKRSSDWSRKATSNQTRSEDQARERQKREAARQAAAKRWAEESQKTKETQWNEPNEERWKEREATRQATEESWGNRLIFWDNPDNPEWLNMLLFVLVLMAAGALVLLSSTC